ncbi:MAG: N-formylglutamate amidohydrolase, partial [Novosphingobium sp.]
MAELLAADEPAPAIVRPAVADGRFVLVADHAGRAIPRRLGDLGVGEGDLRRHVAWDIGIADLAEALATRLGAALIRQRYSRLVIDCNRHPARADAIPAVSDGTVVPANRALAPDERAARVAAIHAPYHAAIAAELARRDAAGADTVLVALHSFTPRMDGAERPWHAGVLYGGGDERFARAVLPRLRDAVDAPVGDNEPYAMEGTDFTVPHHCFAAGRAYLELEIRQDLLEGAE